MKCLSNEQLMELLYREGEHKNLEQYKKHLFECKECLKEFMELMEVREYLKDSEKESQRPVIVIVGEKKKSNWASKLTAAAAILLFASTVIFSVYQTKKIEKAEKKINMATLNLEKKIEEVNYKTEKTAKDNYMLLLGLKNYIDSTLYNSNQNPRRANYERF